MKGRELFIIVDPVETHGELASNPIIQKINSIIVFINNYRFRQEEKRDAAYQKRHLEAAIASDIKAREKIAAYFCDDISLRGIQRAVSEQLDKTFRARWRDKHASIIKEEFDRFLKHKKFIHLTALELAVCGVLVDALIILLCKVQDGLQIDAACVAIAKSQRDFQELRSQIQDCMLYHADIFGKNAKDNQANDFKGSDLLLNLIVTLETYASVDLGKERTELWPDTSYLQIMPILPFVKQISDSQTVKDFCENYFVESPGGDDVRRLQSNVKNELQLVDVLPRIIEPKPSFIVNIPEPVEDSASQGCLPWSFWSKPVPVAKVEVEPDLHRSIIPTNDFSLESMHRLYSNFQAVTKKQNQKMRLKRMLRNEIKMLKDILGREIAELEEPSCCSCFSFFWSATLRKKKAKFAALDYVYNAATLPELGLRAREELGKDLVCAGLWSRTEKVLRRVSQSIPANYEVFAL